jgi:hypothetical protein
MTNVTSAQARANDAKAMRAYKKRKPKNLTPSRTFVNSTQTERLKAPVMASPRAEADQHFQFTGGGYQPQIERAI